MSAPLVQQSAGSRERAWAVRSDAFASRRRGVTAGLLGFHGRRVAGRGASSSAISSVWDEGAYLA